MIDPPSRPPAAMDTLEPRRLMCGLHLAAGESEPSNTAPTTDLAAINAGAGSFVDATGLIWHTDQLFSSGSSSPASADISGTTDDPLFASRRKGMNFAYNIPIPNGEYVVELRFSEVYFNGPGLRLMNIAAEGRIIEHNLDLWSVGGFRTPIARSHNVTVSDGMLNLQFIGTNGEEACVSGIRVWRGQTFAAGSLTYNTRAPQPIRREESVGFVAGGQLYVVGGYINDAFAATTRVDRYNPVGNSWTRLGDAPTKITHPGLATDPQTGLVWMLGGFIGDFPDPQGTAATWKYDPAQDKWTAGPVLPMPGGSGGAGIVGRTLYYISGAPADRGPDLPHVWMLNLDQPAAGWTRGPDLPTPRNHFGFATVGGKIYVFGGQTGLENDSVNLGSVHVLDPQTGAWSARSPMPRPYSHFTFSTDVYQDRYILAIGGESPHGVARSENFVYDTLTDRWAYLTGLPESRRAPAGGIIGDTFIVTGGWIRSRGQRNETWSFNLQHLLPASPPAPPTRSPVRPPTRPPFPSLPRPTMPGTLASDLFGEMPVRHALLDRD
jgi:N-acetylneuraminic acid mutarotase